MKQLKLKFSGPNEAKEVVEWVVDRKTFDPGILSYPTLQVITAYDGRNITHLPVHRALVMESLSVNPDATEIEKAQGLRDVVKGAELLASSLGFKELYFMVSDEQVKKIASSENVGFEIVTVGRLKL